jgi:hypothetical protein
MGGEFKFRFNTQILVKLLLTKIVIQQVTKIEDWISEAQQLIKAINDPSKYVTKTYFTAGYNSPFEIFHRHNEIWFIAK